MTRFPMTPMQLAFHHLGTLTNPNSGELLTFATHLDIAVLKEAIGLALERHPLLNCTPAKHLGRWYWQESDVPLPIDIEVRTTDLSASTELYTELWSNLWESKLSPDGRQVRFIYTIGPTHSYLQVCAPHSVTDACSGTRLAADIGQAYTSLSRGEGYKPKRAEPLGKRGVNPFLSRLDQLTRLGLMWRTAQELIRDLFTDGSGLELPAKSLKVPAAVNITEVPEELLHATIHTARANGTTAHALFLMALTKARREFMGSTASGRTLRINDFATLRPFAEEDLSEAFDVLVVPHQLRINPNWDERTALHILTETINEQKEGGILSELYRLTMYGTLARYLPTRLTAGLVFKLVNKSDLAVTNPGKVPWQDELEAYGDIPILDFVNFPHLLPPAKVVLIFTTFRNQLRVIQLYDPEILPGGVEETLVEPLLRHLKQLTSRLVQTDVEDIRHARQRSHAAASRRTAKAI